MDCVKDFTWKSFNLFELSSQILNCLPRLALPKYKNLEVEISSLTWRDQRLFSLQLTSIIAEELPEIKTEYATILFCLSR